MVEKERNKKSHQNHPKTSKQRTNTTQACFHYIFMYFLKHNQDLLKENVKKHCNTKYMKNH